MLKYLGSRIDTVLPYLRRRRIFEGLPSRSMEGIRFLELSNCWIRYVVAGQGPHTIVIAPDSPVTMEAYAEVLAILSQKHRVLIFETPSFGFSLPKPGFDFSFEAMTETMAEFLRRMNMGPYVLAIPCVAGFSAIAIARRYPDMVTALVSTQTPSWQQERHWLRSLDRMRALTWPIWAQLLGLYLRRKTHFVHKFTTQQRRESLMALSQQTLAQGANNPLASACQCYMPHVREPGWLGKVTQPAISIWGTGDKTHHRAGTDRHSILQYLPDAHLLDFPEAGHFVEAEAPEKFARAVMAFVDELPAARGSTPKLRADSASGV
jgi:pimeloyl-ACP methyl ester carboxylesterase